MATKKTPARKKAPAQKKGRKTSPSDASVEAFLDAVPDPARREDARAVAAMMAKATGEPGVMWGPSIVGFGKVHMKYESGRELDWFLVGLSPRKAHLVVYVMPGFAEYDALRDKLGGHSTGKSCLYIKRLSGVDPKVLERLIRRSVADMRAKHGASSV